MDEVARNVVELALLSKWDLKLAYRNIQVHPWLQYRGGGGGGGGGGYCRDPAMAHMLRCLENAIMRLKVVHVPLA